MSSPTLKEVASAAGVSVATASYALRENHRVAQKTRERVLRIAEKLGYSPNLHAASLRKSETREHATLSCALLQFPFKDKPTINHPHLREEISIRHGFQLERFTIQKPGELESVLGKCRNRGTESILLYGPIDRLNPHYRDLDLWNSFSVLEIGGSSVGNRRSFVSVEENFFLQVFVPWAEAIRRGYQRVGFALYEHPHAILDDHIRHGAVLSCQQEAYGNRRIPPFLYRDEDRTSLLSRFDQWIKKHKLDAVVSFSNEAWWWFRMLGLQGRLGLASMHASQDLDKNPEVSGANSTWTPLTNLIFQVLREQILLRHRGLPAHPYRLALEPSWNEGITLPLRKTPVAEARNVMEFIGHS